ncbi:MAG TPA: TIGR02452 family protein [Actinospica sp.]|nr:TIGR02452 family protein [Actinospica sp.]
MSTYKGIAEANERLVADGWYVAPSGAVVRIGDAVAAACEGTVSYRSAELDSLIGSAGRGVAKTQVEVSGESSMTAARRLFDEGAARIAVLNFASARNAGGGYLRGARAQEEDLCRVSALYTTLRHAPDYYAAHRESRNPAYSHRVIYSPDVPVYRDARYRLLEAPYPVSFLTSPAPNAGVIARDRPADLAALPELLVARASRVLAVAARHGCGSLVLGAWGCGVFRNDPAQVAAAFQRNLTGDGEFAGVFDRIVFAVLDKAAGQPNLTAFRSAFSATG